MVELSSEWINVVMSKLVILIISSPEAVITVVGTDGDVTCGDGVGIG